MSVHYGTAIVKKATGRILDVDPEESREDAQRIVDAQQAKTRDWDISTEWRVVRIEIDDEPEPRAAVEEERQWRVRDTNWGGDRMGAEALMRRYQQTHGGVLEYRRKAGPWTEER